MSTYKSTGAIAAALVIGASVSGCAAGVNGVGVNFGTVHQNDPRRHHSAQHAVEHRSVVRYSSEERHEFDEFVNTHSSAPKKKESQPCPPRAHHAKPKAHCWSQRCGDNHG